MRLALAKRVRLEEKPSIVKTVVDTSKQPDRSAKVAIATLRKNLKIHIESISEDELTLVINVIIKIDVKENLKCTKSLSIKNTYSCDQCEYKTKRKKYLPRHIIMRFFRFYDFF